MSRWISPRWWACLSASATARTIRSASFSSKILFLSRSSLIVVALDVFHHEVVVAVDLAGVDRVDDVVVRELGGDLGLAVEPLDEFLVLGQGVEQDLDGDDPVDARLLGLVDDPHRALAELLEDLVAGDLELLGRLAGLLEQADRLAPGQDLGLDHDLEQALGGRPSPWRRAWPGGPCRPRSRRAWPGRGGGSTSRGWTRRGRRDPRESLPAGLLSIEVAMKPSPWMPSRCGRDGRAIVPEHRTDRRVPGGPASVGEESEISATPLVIVYKLWGPAIGLSTQFCPASVASHDRVERRRRSPRPHRLVRRDA